MEKLNNMNIHDIFPNIKNTHYLIIKYYMRDTNKKHFLVLECDSKMDCNIKMDDFKRLCGLNHNYALESSQWLYQGDK
jgi:hypothetical protein